MKISVRTTFILMLILLFFPQTAITSAPAETAPSVSGYDAVRDGLKDKISNKINSKWFTCRSEIICGISAIPLFYERRDFKPAWTKDDMAFHLAEDLVAAVGEADQHGLLPDDYHFSKIMELMRLVRADHSQTPLDPLIGVDLDILLTDAFLLYASHLISGRVNPETIHSEWEAFSPTTDLAKVLESALEKDAISETLKSISPQNPAYIKLQQGLIQYRKMEKMGEWPRVSNGPTLRLWDFGSRVSSLRKRLSFSETGEASFAEKSDEFDAVLEKKVKEFQKRHGLSTDGVVGPKTLSVMNVSLHERIRQIEINLERQRWIPRDLGKKHLLVNIADFNLFVIEDSTTVMKMRIVAGKSYRKTPVFSGKIKFLVLNPYWNVPTSIAVKDLVPDFCKDIKTLYAKDITVFENWGKNAAQLDPETIDWCHLDRSNFRYKLRQNPGPKNALGRIKFIFPNKYAVYLHDTPQKSLFKRASRGFSSGCIRVENPVELAVYLLQEDPKWQQEAFLAQLETREHKVIGLKTHVPVHLLYLTAWADENGEVQFREDVYERDPALDAALKERAPRDYAKSGIKTGI